ncbi:cbb3-type cytochrome oxidase assembly protein CcoS [Paracoccus gahaiensis]|uniref:Cbb3-type cytochrome oxidase assembly protein CcoS n=1 Tax=Paracoccus gahaiensis TaxID=1706839 RepID=A0A4U0RH18_9RHOB|nr:cbb3-type cytochrome oxidase assembly protein CcoS [Paracoccus gahaiensis]TJZ93990.1 cbb3-type cytochrome oxidase assembly protein CcoS [Paracoccus gahaiensis]
MEILVILIPVSLALGGVGLGAFLWALRNRQFEDPKGDGERVLSDRWDDHPRPDTPPD